MSKQAKKVGRPSSYTPELSEEICALIAGGKTVVQVCRKKGMPHIATLFRWMEAHEEFREAYARAKDVQAEVFAAEIITIADRCRKGKKTETTERGRHCSVCQAVVTWQQGKWAHKDKSPLCLDAKAEKSLETKVVEGDMVERSRLQIDARKWYAAKAAPKKYGDRIALAGDEDSPLRVTIADVLRDRRRRRKEGAQQK